jgi:rubrerythrin
MEKIFVLPGIAKYQILGISMVLMSIFSVFGPAVKAQSEYNETISVLQSLHQDEMQAMHNYQAYAQKAVSQKYPNIGKLFMTLAASESVHARNFKNHVDAIQYITYAWESEKQHRELLKKIKSGTGIFFGFLTKRIEGNPYQYFVCHNCGSTLNEIPASACPICGGLPAKYKEVTLDFDDKVID